MNKISYEGIILSVGLIAGALIPITVFLTTSGGDVILQPNMPSTMTIFLMNALNYTFLISGVSKIFKLIVALIFAVITGFMLSMILFFYQGGINFYYLPLEISVFLYVILREFESKKIEKIISYAVILIAALLEGGLN